MTRPLAWHVATFADGDTHLAVVSPNGGPVKALCGQEIERPLQVLKQEPGRCPPDPAQMCTACAVAYSRTTTTH